MNILIVDPYPAIRCGIRLMLGGDPEVKVVAEADDGSGAMAYLQNKQVVVDLMILDLDLPDRSGFDVLQDVIRLWPQIGVLIFSSHREEYIAVRALKLGAAAYLNKAASAGEMREAVATLRRGKKYISPALAEWLAMDVSGKRQQLPHERLSEREREVFRLLAVGKSISEIADAFSRSPTTISTYRSRILKKMGMTTNAGLTQYALENALTR